MLVATTLISGCAVGPDFTKPKAPEVDSYTSAPIAMAKNGAHVAGGEPQVLVSGQDIPGEWWELFESEPLDNLIRRSLETNPNIKAAQAALKVAHENTLAQYGAYYPAVTGSFSAARQKTSNQLSPVPNSNNFAFNLFTPQVSVSYTPDVFGLNRRTVESLKAEEEEAHFALVATNITLTANVVAQP